MSNLVVLRKKSGFHLLLESIHEVGIRKRPLLRILGIQELEP